MPLIVRRVVKPLVVAAAASGLAGCVTQLPWELPDPYSSGSAGGSSSPYYYGSGTYGYGSGYYGGGYYRDPYYDYRRGGVRRAEARIAPRGGAHQRRHASPRPPGADPSTKEPTRDR